MIVQARKCQRLPGFGFALIFLAMLNQTETWGQTVSTKAEAQQDSDNAVLEDQELGRLITELAKQHLPADYVDDRQWGGQSERWDGLQWSREGWRIETRRRKKQVNHGTWKKYCLWLTNPEKFEIRVARVSTDEETPLQLDVSILAQLGFEARLAKWVKGVQLYSFSASGSAHAELNVRLKLDFQMDASRLPPDLLLVPEANHAELRISDFRLDRVSKAGGEIAQQLGREAKRHLDQAIEKKQAELVTKINRQLKDESDRLRLPLSKLSKWKEQSQGDSWLPVSIRSLVGGGS